MLFGFTIQKHKGFGGVVKMKSANERMFRAATALFNACSKTIKENNCKSCPFSVSQGCQLYEHPYEWEDRIKNAKAARK